MNNIKYIISIITVLCVVVLSSCGQKHTEGDGHNHGSEETTHSDDDGHNHGVEEHQEEGLHLSKAQAETIGLEFG